MSGSTSTPESIDTASSTGTAVLPSRDHGELAEETVDIGAKRRVEPPAAKPTEGKSAKRVATKPAAKTSTAEGSKPEPDADGSDADDDDTGDAKPSRPSLGGALSTRTVSMKSLVSGIAAVAIAAVLAALVWMVVDARSEVGDMKAMAADRAHAEKVALDYSTGAAQMSYEDTQGWLGRLTANTTPELGARLRNAAGQMEQLLRPLQWSSTAAPISAKATSVDGDLFKVDAFVGIVTKNVQAPANGVETTATYKLTIDRSQDWKITEITSNGTNLDGEGATAVDGRPQPGPQTTTPETSAPAAPGN